MLGKVTEDTTLFEILKRLGAEEILAKYKVPCLGCPFAAQEMKKLKIGKVAKMYNIKLSGLLRDLNKI